MNKEELYKTYKAVTGSDVDSSPILAGLFKKADPKFYRQIYKLYVKDQKCIASILDHIAVLVAARKHDSNEKKERRKKSNAKSVKKHRSKKKLIKQLAGNFEFPDTDKKVERIITILSKEVGKNTAKKLALKISHRNNLLDVLGVESTGDLLLPKHLPNGAGILYGPDDNQATKENKYFKTAIDCIYRIAKETTNKSDNSIFELISKILTSLNIRNTKGKKYTRQRIYKIVSNKK